MSSYNELIGILKELLTNRFYPKPEYIHALLGDGQGNVIVPDRPDYNYVRFNRSSIEIFEVFNKEVGQPVDGWPVLIGEFPWQPGLVQVVATDWSAYAQTEWGERDANIQAHAPTHAWPDKAPGSDPLDVYLRAIAPMRTYTLGSGSTSVYVGAYEYDRVGTGTVWGGMPPINLNPVDMVTGTMRFMGVYLNPQGNTLGAVTGTTVALDTVHDPPRPNWPLNVFPSAYVRVYGGQKSVLDSDIVDARRLWNTTLMVTGTSSGGGGWPFAKVLTVSATDPDADYSAINDAITAASVDDVIWIDAGTYTETVVVSKRLTLRGSGVGRTIITSADATTVSLGTVVGATLEDMTILNTNAGALASCVRWAGNSIIINRVKAEKASGGATISAGFNNAGGSNARLTDVETSIISGTSKYGIYHENDAGTMVFRGIIRGDTADIATTTTGSFIWLFNPTLTINGVALSWSGTAKGYYFDAQGNLYQLDGTTIETNLTLANNKYLVADNVISRVKNTSGGAASANAIGYILYTAGSGWEYKVTVGIAEAAVIAPVVVVVGGANNATIKVATRGRFTLTYTGTAPSQGDFLTFSGTGGAVVRQTAQTPDTIAVAMAAGAGGSVDALLLGIEKPIAKAPTNDMVRIDAASNSDFVATIATLPGGATLTYNNPSSGDENNLVPASTSHICKMVLHNTTRGTSALISNSAAATNTITLTANVPAGWQVGDTITIRSQTNTANPLGAGKYFVDFEFTSDFTTPGSWMETFSFIRDTGAANVRLGFHPYEANVTAKLKTFGTQVANVNFSVGTPKLPVISSRFCLIWEGSGTGTMLLLVRLTGQGVKLP